MRAILFALIAAIALSFAAFAPPRLLPRVSTLWPLDLAKPGGWLIDRQISELGADRELCQQVLTGPEVNVIAIGDRPMVAGCGWNNAVQLASAGGARVDLAVASCGVSAALAMWLTHVVQPMALSHFGQKISRLEHLGSFACRNIRGNLRRASHRSQHATANAIDVAGFVLADGRHVVVKKQWNAPSAEGRFLAAIHDGACRYFRVVLGPDYNPAHNDHFHLDRGRWRACR
ncbi:MAG: extensin family protein [Hyphomicrobiales bacterium]